MGMLEITEIKEDMVFLGNTESVKMRTITQKELYEDAILKKSRDHISQTKWVGKLDTSSYGKKYGDQYTITSHPTRQGQQFGSNFILISTHNILTTSGIALQTCVPFVMKFQMTYTISCYIVNSLTLYGQICSPNYADSTVGALMMRKKP